MERAQSTFRRCEKCHNLVGGYDKCDICPIIERLGDNEYVREQVKSPTEEGRSVREGDLPDGE